MTKSSLLHCFVLLFFVEFCGLAQSSNCNFEHLYQIECKKCTVDSLLSSFAQKYKVKLAYLSNQIPLADTIDIKCKKCSIKQSLNQVFIPKNIDVKYIGCTILLVKKQLDSSSVKTAKDTVKRDTLSQRSVTKIYTSLDTLVTVSALNSIKKEKTFGLGSNNVGNRYYDFYYLDSLITFLDSTEEEGKIDTISQKRQKFLVKNHVLEPSILYWKWYLSGGIGLGYTYRKFESNISTEQMNRNLIETKAVGYDLSILLNYQPSKKTILKFGAEILTFGESGTYAVTFNRNDPRNGYFSSDGFSNNPKKGGFPQDSISISDTTISYQTIYKEISFPLSLGYNFHVKKNQLSLSGILGVAYLLSVRNNYPNPQYTVSKAPPKYPDSGNIEGGQQPPSPQINDTVFYYFNYLDSKKYDYKRWNVSFGVSLNYSRDMTHKLRMNIGVIAYTGLSNIYLDDKRRYLSEKFYLNIGLSYLLTPQICKSIKMI